MAAQGHAAINGEFGGTSSSSVSTPSIGIGGKGDVSTSTDVATGTDTRQSNDTGPSPVSAVPPSAEQGPANGGKDIAGSPQPMAHSNGCAYGGNDARSISLWMALGMAGLVVGLARRRRGDR
jgi:MYXO-CTERM domain-containing protein